MTLAINIISPHLIIGYFQILGRSNQHLPHGFYFLRRQILKYRLCAQTLEFGSDFTLSQPLGTMANNMNNAFGLTFEVVRNFKTPFSAGAEIGFGTYGYQTSRQQYAFDDGSATETNVNVSNNIFNIRVPLKTPPDLLL